MKSLIYTYQKEIQMKLLDNLTNFDKYLLPFLLCKICLIISFCIL